MQMQRHNATAEREASATRFGRLLLLILLVLLPMSVALACPEPPVHLAPEHVEQDLSSPAHGPSTPPACHHDRHLGKGPVLLGDQREAEPVEPTDNGAVIPHLELTQARLSGLGALRQGALSTAALPAVPVYLLTLRLRV